MKISIVIPHYNGKQILERCLLSLQKNKFESYEIIVIDNGSSDGSQQLIKNKFSAIRLVENKNNLGFAGGCNAGIKLARGDFVLLLNNDVEVADNFLDELYKTIIQDQNIGIVQPKLLSIQKPDFFDYSGAAGGEIDIFGFPFARGRVFIEIEKDQGQYDRLSDEIFWGSGTACLIRRSMIEKIGMLDEDFFAHMEEIDLNWRAHLTGYRSVITVKTFLYHYSGYTLSTENPRKMYLNHRNNLIMLIKNYSAAQLMWILPVRIVLEFAALFYALSTGNQNWAKGVVNGLAYVVRNFTKIRKKRLQVQKLRTVKDREIMRRMYKGSVAFSFFIRKKSSFAIIRSLLDKRNS